MLPAGFRIGQHFMKRDRARWRSMGSNLALLVALAGCALTGTLRSRPPDATVDLGQGWEQASACAQEQLTELFNSAVAVNHPADGYAEITVAGNFAKETVMVVFVQDVTPGKAQAQIHAHDYMLLWGGPTDRAVAGLAKCRGKAAP